MPTLESTKPSPVSLTAGPINITSREFKAHSDEYYARLRRETPVFCTTLPDKQTAWLVTR
jgi:hypothetical protein